MTNRRRTIGLFALSAVLVAAVVLSYRFAPGDIPPGQPPLVTLDAASLERLRADFNRDVNVARVIVLLSPT
jgi:hypothetical protein